MKQSSQNTSFELDELQAAISSGLEFLSACQEPDGHLPSYVATDLGISQERKEDRSVFITQHIIASLLNVNHPSTNKIIQQGAAFLKKECLSGGLWKFWTKDHPGFCAIPPDVDDTSCVAHLLEQLGERCTHKNRAIVLGNRSPAGLIRTWILPRSAHLHKPHTWSALKSCLRHPLQLLSFFSQGHVSPEDLDAVVMANAVLWLGECPETQPAIDWLHEVVCAAREEESDRYYQSPYPLYYSIARSTKIGHTAFDELRIPIVERIRLLLRLQVEGLDILSLALIAVVLGTWLPDSPEYSMAIQKILASQRSDGSWPARAFFFGACTKDKAWGSEALTTGFCLEALSLCGLPNVGAEPN